MNRWTKVYGRWRKCFLDPRLAARVRIEPDCLFLDGVLVHSLVLGYNYFPKHQGDCPWRDALVQFMRMPLRAALASDDDEALRCLAYLDRRVGLRRSILPMFTEEGRVARPCLKMKFGLRRARPYFGPGV